MRDDVVRVVVVEVDTEVPPLMDVVETDDDEVDDLVDVEETEV